ncbi:MAG: hypothetical protein AABX65_02720 [Nanoarchaeota archaeon]
MLKNLLTNKKGSLGTTLTWIIAFVAIILVLLAFSIFVGFILASGKAGSSQFSFVGKETKFERFDSTSGLHISGGASIDSQALISTKQLAMFLTQERREDIANHKNKFVKDAAMFVNLIEDEETCYALCWSSDAKESKEGLLSDGCGGKIVHPSVQCDLLFSETNYMEGGRLDFGAGGKYFFVQLMPVKK